MNKCDLVAAELRINLKAQIVKRLGKDEGGEVMLVSAKTGEGIEALKRAVVEELGGIS